MLIAGTALCLLTMLIVVDVTLLYLGNATSTFSYDLILPYLTPLVFFLRVGPTYAHNEHLAVDLLTARLDRGAPAT